MKLFKQIFFDLDNTLFSHEYAFEKAIQDCFLDMRAEWEARGIETPNISTEDWFDVFKYYSDLFWDSYEKKQYTQKEYRRKRYLETMGHFALPCSTKDADYFHEKYYEQAIHYVQPYPGMTALLQFLHEHGIHIGVITNGKSEVQWAKYEKLKLFRYINQNDFFVSEEVGVEKPNPFIFQKALGGENPVETLFIGDAWEHDVVGSLTAGWQAIYLNTLHRPPTSIHQPLAELQHLHQVLPFLQTLASSKKK